MRRWLIDAGPLVAYVDASDPAHAAVVRALDEFRGHLYTTTAVVTEAMHLVADDPEGPAVLVEFLIATGTAIAAKVRTANANDWRLGRRAETPLRASVTP